MKCFRFLAVLVLVGAVVSGLPPVTWGDGGEGDGEHSHFRYGTLSWVPTANPGEVEFRLTAAFRRGYSGSGPDGRAVTGDIITETIGATRLLFGDATSTPTLRFRVTAFSVTENWVIGEALHPSTTTVGVRHTYAGAGPYTAAVSTCCRIGGLNNRNGGSYRLETIVRPQSGNRSPVSTLVPIVTVSESNASTFFIPAVDADGDQLRWRAATSAEAGGGSNPSGMSINSSTGLVTWNNVGFNQTNFWTAQFVIEDLDANGNVKSKTPVDFLLKIVKALGVPPSCAINPAGPLTVSAGSPVSFTVTGTDPDQGALVTLNTGGLPAGATMSPGLPITGPSGVNSTFNWTPTATQVGIYVVLFSVTDNTGQQALCSITITVIPANNPPPFSIDKPLPDPNARLCLPPFMVQDPFKTHFWWARATGVGNLEIELIALAVNPAETGSATIKVFGPHPSNTLVGTATVNHPATGETSAPLVVVSSPSAGALYRIEVSVGPSSPPPPSPTAQARHYRLELKGASMLGANSPLQAQAEHDDARWAVNVGASENLDVLVSGGPEAPATTGTVEARNPSGALVASAPIGTPINISGAAAGQWTIAVHATPPALSLNGHYVIDKTTGADRGLYVTWMTWGFGMLSGAITRGGLPNATPVTVEIKDNLTGAVVQTIPGTTSSYSVPKLFVGSYMVSVITPPNLQAPPSATVVITCDGKAVANFDIPNRHPTCDKAAPSIAEIWPPNHKMVNISILNVTDPDGDPVTITVTKITQDEPLNTVGDGNFEPDGGGIGTSTAQVRAERTGTPRIPGNGRCYHITFTASDGFPQGGTCEGVVRTCVPHDQAHPAVDDGPKFNSVTGVPVAASKPIAAEFTPEAMDLSFGVENYPNPFNPSTTIRYTLPEASNVRLTIFNVLGQEVRTLVNAAQARGVHSVQWDGRDASGRPVATGVYIYRLEAGQFVATRNMVFTK